MQGITSALKVSLIVLFQVCESHQITEKCVKFHALGSSEVPQKSWIWLIKLVGLRRVEDGAGMTVATAATLSGTSLSPFTFSLKGLQRIFRRDHGLCLKYASTAEKKQKIIKLSNSFAEEKPRTFLSLSSTYLHTPAAAWVC